MAYREPEVIVRDVTSNSEVTTVLLDFLRHPDSAPIAPGALYSPSDLRHWTFELHRLVERKNLTLTFETYRAALPPPEVDRIYAFRSWWTKMAAEAVLDNSARWVERTIPGIHEHEHCLITWETMHSGELGCFSAKHGWITNDAYRTFIEEDRYRIRAGRRDWRDL
jgi:hypothetical protein